jgi:hypothetical protein
MKRVKKTTCSIEFLLHSLVTEVYAQLSSCRVVTLAILLQRGGSVFLTVHTEEPSNVTNLSGLLLIEHQYYQVFIQGVHVFIGFSLCLTMSPLHETSPLFCKPLLWKALHFQQMFYENFFDTSSKTYALKSILHVNTFRSTLYFMLFHMHRRIHCSKNDCALVWATERFMVSFQGRSS